MRVVWMVVWVVVGPRVRVWVLRVLGVVRLERLYRLICSNWVKVRKGKRSVVAAGHCVDNR